ncbi:HEAT repeat domain-containing protein [Streptomyces sp. NPDC101118]|uniref:HEAT repeat domain-containing protein n=1 Tax=Streptomyces sp. NPDC101118 TaxID=3366109 RepID=UPI003821CB79
MRAGQAIARALLDHGGPGGGTVAGPGTPEAWVAFDACVRRELRTGARRGAWDGPGGWSAPGVPVGLRLCHPDGHVREAALRRPYRVSLPLPLVVIRCTDPVPAVRARARQRLVAMLAAWPRETVLQSTGTVLLMSARRHGGWALEFFESALHAREPRLAQWWRARPGRGQAGEMLAALRRDRHLPTRRFAVRLTLAGRGAVVGVLAREAVAEADPGTARLWTDAVLAALGGAGMPAGRWQQDSVAVAGTVDALLGARQPQVRAAGVTALGPAGRGAEAVRHLTDPSHFVRARARLLVGEQGGDPAGLYRRLVADPAGPSPYAVAGLAECGGDGAVPVLQDLLAHPAGPVRAAALAGLRLVDAVGTDDLLAALMDDAAPVVREACRGLLRWAKVLDPDDLSPLLAPNVALPSRRAAFRLLRARGGIHELRAAVALLKDGNPELRATAWATVRGCDWDARRFEDPAQRGELTGLLRKSGHLFTRPELDARRRLLEAGG